MKASSGINGAPTRFQSSYSSHPDTTFLADSIKSAGSVFADEAGERRARLMEVLTGESESAIEWLVGKGVDLSVVGLMGGHSCARTHRGSGTTPPGVSLVMTLLNALKASEIFELWTGCVVTKVLRDGAVKGVEYACSNNEDGTGEARAETKTLFGPVIFASGGFAGDSGSSGMLSIHRPDLAGFPSTNTRRPGSQGLLTEVGAQLIDMKEVQVHPTAFIDPAYPLEPVKFLAAEMLRGEGGLMLFEGKRFVNELETRKCVTETIISLQHSQFGEGKLKQWDVQVVLDEATYQRMKSHVDFYIFKKLMRKTTIAEVHPASLASIVEYSTYASEQVKDPLGRTKFGRWALKNPTLKSVVYVGTVTPAIHFTMGGVVIDEFARVMEIGTGEGDGEDKAIDGLWAAGEVTGGVHGENRLGGSSLLECVVFGRRAGQGAANGFLDMQK